MPPVLSLDSALAHAPTSNTGGSFLSGGFPPSSLPTLDASGVPASTERKSFSLADAGSIHKSLFRPDETQKTESLNDSEFSGEAGGSQDGEDGDESNALTQNDIVAWREFEEKDFVNKDSMIERDGVIMDQDDLSDSLQRNFGLSEKAARDYANSAGPLVSRSLSYQKKWLVGAAFIGLGSGLVIVLFIHKYRTGRFISRPITDWAKKCLAARRTEAAADEERDIGLQDINRRVQPPGSDNGQAQRPTVRE